MFEHPDWIGWALGAAGLVIGAAGFAFGVLTDCRARKRRDMAHAGLVSLKAAIEGPNKEHVVAAINDLLSKLK